MVQVKALKTYRGEEGLVRRGDVFEVSEERAKRLLFVRNVEVYADRMAAAPRNQMRRSPDPKGMTAENAGGLVTFGPGEGEAEAAGNAQGTTAVPIGSPTGEAVSQSSSPADPPPLAPITIGSDGRRLRGRRPS